MKYVFRRNEELNTVDVANEAGLLLFRWTLTGNIERRFTTHLMGMFMSRSSVYNVLTSYDAVIIEHPCDLAVPVALFAPPEYQQIKPKVSLWVKLKEIFFPT